MCAKLAGESEGCHRQLLVKGFNPLVPRPLERDLYATMGAVRLLDCVEARDKAIKRLKTELSIALRESYRLKTKLSPSSRAICAIDPGADANALFEIT